MLGRACNVFSEISFVHGTTKKRRLIADKRREKMDPKVIFWQPEITAGGCIFLKFLRLAPKGGERKQRNSIERVGGILP
jgi:hypothetical protein